jgi:hypothetical protein
MKTPMMFILFLILASNASAQKAGTAEHAALDYFQIQQLVAK